MVENEENFELTEEQATETVEVAEENVTKKSSKKNEKRWYIVQTYSGYENKVKGNLEKRIEYMNMSDKIFRVEVPQKTVTQIKGGKKLEKDEKIFLSVFLSDINDFVAFLF